MSTGSQKIGAWNKPIAGVGPRRSQPSYSVPDDWEAESNDEDKDPRRVWEEADAKAPMPEILIAPGASAAPPPTAFAPSLRILKRPQSASPKPSGPSTPQKTLAEREAQYKAARERIFAAKPESSNTASPSSSSTVSPSSSSTAETSVGAGTDKAPQSRTKSDKPDNVVRQPRGPSSNSGKGFGNRRAQGTGTLSAGGSGAQSPVSQASSPRTQTPAPRPEEGGQGNSSASA